MVNKALKTKYKLGSDSPIKVSKESIEIRDRNRWFDAMSIIIATVIIETSFAVFMIDSGYLDWIIYTIVIYIIALVFSYQAYGFEERYKFDLIAKKLFFLEKKHFKQKLTFVADFKDISYLLLSYREEHVLWSKGGYCYIPVCDLSAKINYRLNCIASTIRGAGEERHLIYEDDLEYLANELKQHINCDLVTERKPRTHDKNYPWNFRIKHYKS